MTYRIIVTVWLAASPTAHSWSPDGVYATRRACNEAAVEVIRRLRIGQKDSAKVHCVSIGG